MSYTEKQKAKMKIYSGNKAYYYEYDCNGEIRNLKLTPPMKGGHTHNHKWNSWLRYCDKSKDSRHQKHNFEQYKRCCEFTWKFPWNNRRLDYLDDVQ